MPKPESVSEAKVLFNRIESFDLALVQLRRKDKVEINFPDTRLLIRLSDLNGMMDPFDRDATNALRDALEAYINARRTAAIGELKTKLADLADLS